MVTDVTIKNSGRLDVLLTAVRSSASDWIDLQQPTVEVNPLRAGEELDIVFAIKTDRMSIGKTAFLLTFLVEVSSLGSLLHEFGPLLPLISFLFRMTTTQIASSQKRSISGF